jgi:hypothetical protein
LEEWVRIRSCEIGRPSLFTWFCAIAGLLVNSNAAQTDIAVTNAVMGTKLWEIGFLLVVFGQAYKHNQKPLALGGKGSVVVLLDGSKRSL